VEGNEKADEGVRQTVEEPDARGVEWLEYGIGMAGGGRPSPGRWPVSGEKSRRRGGLKPAGGRRNELMGGSTYRMPRSQHPNRAVE